MKHKQIFVIGHMGAGKCLFAEALAKKLNYDFIDVNPSLERYIGRSLVNIIGKEGKKAFHRCESEIITHYQKQDKVVILLEEGVIDSEENRQLLSSQFVIYLKVSVSEQLKRMKDSRKSVLPINDLSAFLEKQHADRDEHYEAVASLILDSVSVDDDVEKAVQVITTHSESN